MKYGIKSITMDDVAKELGISKKTLYQSFKDKEELIIRVMDHLLVLWQNKIFKIKSEKLNAIEQLTKIQHLIISILKNYSDVMLYDLRKYYPHIYNEIYQHYIQIIEDLIVFNIQSGKNEGVYRQSLNDQIIAKLHVARIMNMPESNVITLEEYTSQEFMDELFEYHIRGLVNEKGSKILNIYLKKLNQNSYAHHEGN
jgi:AcrR family transcriptional regulator